MKKLSVFALVLALGSTMVGCGDDNTDDPTPAGKTTSERLMAKSWMITASTLQVGTGKADDMYAEEEACNKDNIYKFEANKVFTLDEGKTRCDEDTPQSVKGTWELTNNDKDLKSVISYSNPLGEVELEISGTLEEVSDTKFVVVSKETDSGVTTTTRTTFTAQ
ncbi:hypothetical protein DNI29_06635 [Hymenobacter sediminis]|uniref:hypothetical protein n=1 Tax=Hymenobacter sediminis TaxID=2218621 RepID=UPI000DA6A9FE|nr:hypothetical protein [Hymenobacter sediminis]RPD48299.1 hypothetical protein DNI29_06635 [Hymenobacter sediminis]